MTRWLFWLAASGAVAGAVAASLAVRAWIRFEDGVDAGGLFLSFGSYQSARDDLDLALAACTLLGIALLVCLGVGAVQRVPWPALRWAALVLAVELLLRIGVVWADGSTAREIRRGYAFITASTLGFLATGVALALAARGYNREGSTASMR
ncbi:MAG TPA: hypothetical protein VFX21_07410 [Acidimicrobiia bacterium]|nr:hypothetical protein [Acidimicrobiia bacterium]